MRRLAEMYFSAMLGRQGKATVGAECHRRAEGARNLSEGKERIFLQGLMIWRMNLHDLLRKFLSGVELYW